MKLFLCKDVDAVREMCVKRSEELDEAQVETYRPPVMARPVTVAQVSGNPDLAGQSPSTLAAMARHAQQPIPAPPMPMTPAAAQALADRQAIINDRVNPKKEEKRSSPRKF